MAKPKRYDDAILTRCTKEEKADFIAACNNAREVPAQVIRDMMRHYCRVSTGGMKAETPIPDDNIYADLTSATAATINQLRDALTLDWVDQSEAIANGTEDKYLG